MSSDCSLSKKITSYIETFYDPSEYAGSILSPSFSFIARRYILWLLGTHKTIEEIKQCTESLHLKPNGALELAHLINVTLSSVPLLWPHTVPQVVAFFDCMRRSLLKLSQFKYLSLDLPALEITLRQIIVRCVRLGMTPFAAELGRVFGVREAEVQELEIACLKRLKEDIEMAPDLLFGSSVITMNILETGFPAYSSKLLVALEIPVLYTAPLLRPEPAIIPGLDYTHSPDRSSMSASARSLSRSYWEGKRMNLKAEVLAGVENVDIFLLNKAPPAPIMDPRLGHTKKKVLTLGVLMDAAIAACMDAPAFEKIISLLSDKVSPYSQRAETGESIMMAAAATGSLEIIKTLYDSGCPIRLRCKQGRSPLDIAFAKKRDTSVINLLNELEQKERFKSGST